MARYIFILKSVTSIIINFEISSFKTIGEKFIYSKVYGFSFHFGQIVWRRTQLLKFLKQITKSYQVKL